MSGAIDNVFLVYVLINTWNREATSEDYLQKQWL